MQEIFKELGEVEEQLDLDNIAHLEDELGDVLWDYLNILRCLEYERGISIPSVFSRALAKYEERISGIENGVPWSETKALQKEKLTKEIEQRHKHLSASRATDE